MLLTTRRQRQVSGPSAFKKYKSYLPPAGALEIARLNALPANPFSRRRAAAWHGHGPAAACKWAANNNQSITMRLAAATHALRRIGPRSSRESLGNSGC